MLVDAEKDRNHHHTDGKTGTAKHHGLLSAHTIQCHGRKGVSNDEHKFHEAGNQECTVAVESNVLDQNTRHAVRLSAGS